MNGMNGRLKLYLCRYTYLLVALILFTAQLSPKFYRYTSQSLERPVHHAYLSINNNRIDDLPRHNVGKIVMDKRFETCNPVMLLPLKFQLTHFLEQPVIYALTALHKKSSVFLRRHFLRGPPATTSLLYTH